MITPYLVIVVSW